MGQALTPAIGSGSIPSLPTPRACVMRQTWPKSHVCGAVLLARLQDEIPLSDVPDQRGDPPPQLLADRRSSGRSSSSHCSADRPGSADLRPRLAHQPVRQSQRPGGLPRQQHFLHGQGVQRQLQPAVLRQGGAGVVARNGRSCSR